MVANVRRTAKSSLCKNRGGRQNRSNCKSERCEGGAWDMSTDYELQQARAALHVVTARRADAAARTADSASCAKLQILGSLPPWLAIGRSESHMDALIGTESSNPVRSANTSYADNLSVRGPALKSPGTRPFLAGGCAPWARAVARNLSLTTAFLCGRSLGPFGTHFTSAK
jgi:hypothetical protein